MIRLILLLAVPLLLPPPAQADSQSSNSSSNCSNGRCWRLDSYVVEDRHGRRGHVREERWRERGHHDRRRAHPGPYWIAPWGYAPRRGRDDDD